MNIKTPQINTNRWRTGFQVGDTIANHGDIPILETILQVGHHFGFAILLTSGLSLVESSVGAVVEELDSIGEYVLEGDVQFSGHRFNDGIEATGNKVNLHATQMQKGDKISVVEHKEWKSCTTPSNAYLIPGVIRGGCVRLYSSTMPTVG